MAAARRAQAANERNLWPSKGDYHHMNQTGAPFFLQNSAGGVSMTYRQDGVDITEELVRGSAPMGPVPTDLADVVSRPLQ